ncbi:MAG: hypothetical protein EBT06_02120 [Gammaproteobacteria bacterium]|nr:hypothetical protein [Gammaproteobacteria bacterium]NBT43716.1 hypothetical protein [Gammaproteobacteria bacterium]NBY23738.1 hypothetical protein [Gammaproteobacteria bacterium]NDE33425.1 hypothetical protein [Gammaproteobacteria bacterium]NDE55508.1 hypothetical protein [Gammaproteobacteria bacterium]
MRHNHQGIIPITLLIFFLSCWLLLPSWTEPLVTLEYRAISNIYGTQRIEDSARLVEEAFSPLAASIKDSSVRFQTLPRHLRHALIVWTLRGMTLKGLVPLGALILLITLVDLEVHRAIRLTNFSYPSPMRHQSSRMLLLAYVNGLLLSLIAPWPWPPYSLEGLWLLTPLVIHLHLKETPKRT